MNLNTKMIHKLSSIAEFYFFSRNTPHIAHLVLGMILAAANLRNAWSVSSNFFRVCEDLEFHSAKRPKNCKESEEYRINSANTCAGVCTAETQGVPPFVPRAMARARAGIPHGLPLQRRGTPHGGVQECGPRAWGSRWMGLCTPPGDRPRRSASGCLPPSGWGAHVCCAGTEAGVLVGGCSVSTLAPPASRALTRGPGRSTDWDPQKI